MAIALNTFLTEARITRHNLLPVKQVGASADFAVWSVFHNSMYCLPTKRQPSQPACGTELYAHGILLTLKGDYKLAADILDTISATLPEAA